MNLKRKSALALLALGVGVTVGSGAAFAGTYTHACKNIPVSIPCENKAWDIGFEIFWVEATSNEETYTMDQAPNIDKYYAVAPDFSMGFELQGSFHFGTGKDVTVAWERVHDDDHAFNTKAAEAYSSYWPSSTGVANNRHTGLQDHEFDAVVVEFGQHVDLGDDVDMRGFAGLHYARIDYTKETRLDADTTSPTIYTYESDFEGVGGRVGGDASYNIRNNCYAVIHTSFSLLVGDIQTFAHMNSTPKTGFQIRAFDVVIPAAMVKAGFSHEVDAYGGHMTVEGGWRWEGYYSALRFYMTVASNYENFTFHGPYLSVLYVS